ncbi:NfeD family protein [Paracidovorax anthurii]|uniref:Membrane protein implicated in regulation of membrane protease activity n=1 Tax=Paracidovorax anthurii TaxID=78229 RepID=A0A328ZL97_9BURK|nr:NfeD family protein [Paracidovorax anthurii]RAR85432.1 membrane protein implicated in regulation of membrane protease activity [Paracidovorax anthurii]
MQESTIWWLMVGAMVAAELVTGTFYLLMLSLGLAAGAVAAHLGMSLALQLSTAALVGSIGVVACHQLRKRRPGAQPASRNRDVNLDIGETVHVEAWSPDGTAQVRYRGAQWAVVLRAGAGAASAPGSYQVTEVIGNRLVVDKP